MLSATEFIPPPPIPSLVCKIKPPPYESRSRGLPESRGEEREGRWGETRFFSRHLELVIKYILFSAVISRRNAEAFALNKFTIQISYFTAGIIHCPPFWIIDSFELNVYTFFSVLLLFFFLLHGDARWGGPIRGWVFRTSLIIGNSRRSPREYQAGYQPLPTVAISIRVGWVGRVRCRLGSLEHSLARPARLKTLYRSSQSILISSMKTNWNSVLVMEYYSIQSLVWVRLN